MKLRYEVRMQIRPDSFGDTMGCFNDKERAIAVMWEQISKGSKWARVYDLQTSKNILMFPEEDNEKTIAVETNRK